MLPKQPPLTRAAAEMIGKFAARAMLNPRPSHFEVSLISTTI
jgi:hypothetical protein